MIRESTPEYDAFGPWILYINEEYTMPPLFIDYYHEKETPLMLIKIPRKIERRSATPYMHLYDYVIGLFDSYLYILKRNDHRVSEKRIQIKDIIAIKHKVSLLFGQLSFYLNDETLDIEYNTVSDDIIFRLIDLIRQRYTAQERRLDIKPMTYSIKTIQHRYACLIDKLVSDDAAISLVAYQPVMDLKTKYKNVWQKVIRFFMNRVLSATAFLTNNKELIVLEREKPIINKNRMEMTYSCLYLPYKNLTDVVVRGHEEIDELKTMQVKTHNKQFSFLFGGDNRQVDELCHALKPF